MRDDHHAIYKHQGGMTRMADLNPTPYEDIYSEIKETLLLSRNQAYSAVNFAMVQAYWRLWRNKRVVLQRI